MKGRIFVVVVLVAVSAFAGRWVNRSRGAQAVAQPGAQASGSQREETRQSFRLDAGARVEVSKINGKVEVRSADVDTAEVHIVRTGASAEDMEYGRISVEASPSALVVRGEGGGGNNFWRWLTGGGQVRQEVTLLVPRGVELAAGHVNGALSVGEIDGALKVSHVNGRVEVAQAAGRAEVSHVNGGVKLGLSQAAGEGLDISHVNGSVEIRLKQAVDADVEVQGHNGGLSLNVANLTMQERLNRSYTRARFGAGGAHFEISHVNGGVRFDSDAAAAATTTTMTTTALPVVVAVPAGDVPVPPLPPAPPALPRQ